LTEKPKTQNCGFAALARLSRFFQAKFF